MSVGRAHRNRSQGQPPSFASWVKRARMQKQHRDLEMPSGLLGLQAMIGADRVQYRPPRRKTRGAARSKPIYAAHTGNARNRASARAGAQRRRPASASTSRRRPISPPRQNALGASAVWKSWVVQPAPGATAAVPVDIAPQFKERLPRQRVSSSPRQSARARRPRPFSAPAKRPPRDRVGTIDVPPGLTGSRVRMHAFGARHGELRAARQAAQLHLGQSHFRAADGAADGNCGSSATVSNVSIYDIEVGRGVVNKGQIRVPSALTTQRENDGKSSPQQSQQLATQPAAVLVSSKNPTRPPSPLLLSSQSSSPPNIGRAHAGTRRFAASPTRLGGGFNTLCRARAGCSSPPNRGGVGGVKTDMSAAVNHAVPGRRPRTANVAVHITHAPTFAPSITATTIIPEPRVRLGGGRVSGGGGNGVCDGDT